MAYEGDWGTFVHIPKCGGQFFRRILYLHIGKGEEVGDYHGLPWDIKDGFTVVRHPVMWLRSLWTYRSNSGWETTQPKKPNWPIILGLTQWAKGLTWSEFVEALYEQGSDIVSTVFGMYRHPNVRIYKLEQLDKLMDDLNLSNTIAVDHNETLNKPPLKPDEVRMLEHICRDSILEYGYDN